MDQNSRGNLIIIGGAEDKKNGKSILKEVYERVKDLKGNLIIASLASCEPEEAAAVYKDIFFDMGLNNVSTLDIKERKDAFLESNLNAVNSASAIFFTGGDQLRITSMLGGTALYDAIIKKNMEGCIIIGTSAGASVMSDTMIVTGPEEESPKKCTLKMAPGFGFIRGVIIDQHFAQRGRIGRLLVGVAENPQSLGIGIDEDTAVLVDNVNKIQVLGSGAVYIIDGSQISRSNVSEQYPNEVLSIFNVKMHVLKNGNKFDLNKRIPLLEEERNENSII